MCCCPYRRLAGKSFSYRGQLPSAPPGWLLLLSLKEGEKNKRGSVQLSTPPMPHNERVYISPPLAASTNHVAFYSSIITGFEGRKKWKKTFHGFCRSGRVSRMFRFVLLDSRNVFVSCGVYARGKFPPAPASPEVSAFTAFVSGGEAVGLQTQNTSLCSADNKPV